MLFAGGLVIESCFVNIVHSTWFGRYAREDSNFFRAVLSVERRAFFFFTDYDVPFFRVHRRVDGVAYPFRFFRGFVVLSSRLFSKLLKI